MFTYYPKEKIYSFEKGPNQEVQFATTERKGKTFLDIRIFHIQEDGAKVATHKGIYFEAEKLQEFKAGIEKLIEASENGQ